MSAMPDIPLITLSPDQYEAMMRFKSNERYSGIWERRGRPRCAEKAVMPDLWLYADGQEGEVEGLVLDCQCNGPRDQFSSYDLNGVFVILDLYGDVVTVAAWMATELQFCRIDNTCMKVRPQPETVE